MIEATPPKEQSSSSARTARILVAEDDAALRQLLEMSLRAFGYEVLSAEDGEAALEAFLDQPVDLVILDIMMPRMDGLQVLQEIRRRSDVPVIMLTALGRPDDVVRGLRMGADDYIPKPFTFKEVAARVEAALRRAQWSREQRTPLILQGCGIKLNVPAREAYVDGKQVHLSPTEFALLHYLMHRAGQAVSKEELFQNVWGYEFSGGSNLIEVAIRRLRYKIEENPQKPRRIITVRGVGYRFGPCSEDAPEG